MNKALLILKWRLLCKHHVKMDNGDLYVGDLVGESYMGDWRTKTGKGIYLWANGDVYEGRFVDGIPHGKGKYHYVNGDVYKGYFCNGKQQGPGEFFRSFGEMYSGDWHDGKRNGRGTFSYHNGDVYEGNWLNDMQQGVGTLWQKGYGFYIGNWKKGKKHGYGEFYHENGDVYREKWQNDSLCGKAEITLADGSVVKAEFDHNELKSSKVVRESGNIENIRGEATEKIAKNNGFSKN